MSSLVEEALKVLYAAKVPLAPGLSPRQLEDVEEQFSFGFSPDHARFLSLAMPIGPGWVDWLRPRRNSEEARLAARWRVV
ncbi:hypothetical protein OVA06_13735 [Pseudarthrobacter sp. SL88]|uniref:hypothetical protein n=1 Tax=Pseudarthrobacter sp. SL88 TaxID=2994666 RepID=UPI002275A77A|nr:hypothetical protein [Pseudarthrobacter sp. SL88]MCY1675755.1 hypothetical protein [Pseudarthrobacter sp. SL88]